MSPGYPGTPQSRKLGLKAGQRVALDQPPPGWGLTEPPDGLLAPDPDGAADLIVAFFRAAPEIPARLPALAQRISPAGAIWAAWPRRAAGHDSDITDNVVRAHALDLGLVDVKVAAIDDDWSGLRLVWRAARLAWIGFHALRAVAELRAFLAYGTERPVPRPPGCR
jgi:hypothetical protein